MVGKTPFPGGERWYCRYILYRSYSKCIIVSIKYVLHVYMCIYSYTCTYIHEHVQIYSHYLRRVKYVCVISNAQNTWMNNNFSAVGLEPKFCQHCACRWPSTATVLNKNTECFPTSYPGYFVTLLLTGRRHSMMTSSSGNIFCVTGPLWGIHRSQQMFEQKSRRRWFETPSHSLWRHCNTKWATRSRDRSRHL